MVVNVMILVLEVVIVVTLVGSYGGGVVVNLMILVLMVVLVFSCWFLCLWCGC